MEKSNVSVVAEHDSLSSSLGELKKWHRKVWELSLLWVASLFGSTPTTPTKFLGIFTPSTACSAVILQSVIQTWILERKDCRKREILLSYVRSQPAFFPATRIAFDLYFLAIGPYHHRKEELKFMEACKAELIEKSPGLRGFEAQVREFLPQILSFYPSDIRDKFQTNFEEMIVKDAFFVVFVVYLRLKQVSNGLDSTDCSGIRNFDPSMLQFCVRDLLIADNQLPWPVVDKVSSLVFGGEKNGRFMIDKFLSTVMSGKSSTKVPDDLFDGDPLHLLDLLRRKYLVDYVYPEDDRFVLYSAKELPMRGVNIVEAVPQNGFLVGGVRFCGKTATLALPCLTICEHFKHTFLNMAGYEATPGICNNGEITKFLCLFRGLLRDPESVAIMRKFILCEGDDETIMELFNKMCQNLHPDFLIYEVSEEDQMSQFGFLDKVKRQSREFYETSLASLLEALGVVAAVNEATIWYRGLYQMYLNHQMEVEILLGAAIMFILRNLLGKVNTRDQREERFCGEIMSN